MHPPQANTWAIVARPTATRITPAAAVILTRTRCVNPTANGTLTLVEATTATRTGIRMDGTAGTGANAAALPRRAVEDTHRTIEGAGAIREARLGAAALLEAVATMTVLRADSPRRRPTALNLVGEVKILFHAFFYAFPPLGRSSLFLVQNVNGEEGENGSIISMMKRSFPVAQSSQVFNTCFLSTMKKPEDCQSR